MRKTVAILMLVVLLLPAVVTIGVYRHRRSEWKHAVKEMIAQGVDTEYKKVFTFSKDFSENELEWEHSKEFEYKGEMYDVIRKEEHGDSITYYCFWDTHETGINNKYRTALNTTLLSTPIDGVAFFKAELISNTFTTLCGKADNGIALPRVLFALSHIYTDLHKVGPTVPPPQFVA